MNNMIISYYSLGCKVNLYESEAIINKFIDNGFTLGKFNEKCDVYLINTCSVTEVSDAKSRKIIRQAIKQNENAVVAVMGCYAQLKPEDIKKIEGVDVLIGTSNRDKIYDLIMEAINNKTTITCVDEILNVTKYEELKIDRFNDKTRGFIKIEDGCDNYCSYCTIPYARGHVRSRLKDDVIFEIQALTNSGIKEIVLAGINTGHYGKDLSDYDFSDLLDEICTKVNNLGKLRISSIEMTEITEKLLNTMKKHETHFCNQIHIPLQGGCNNTLKRMHRKYNTQEYYEKMELIRSYFPDINITTDVMTGFSGETLEDFNDSLKFIESVGYGEMHVFPYSRRERTVAYHYDNIVDPIEKKRRVSLLLELNKKQAIKYRNLFINKELEVLIEKEKNGYYYGHTSNYLEVMFKNKDINNTKVNEYCKVLITNVDYPICKGEMK